MKPFRSTVALLMIVLLALACSAPQNLAPRFVLEVNTTGGGSVVRSPEQSSYAQDQEVVLTAMADDAWMFSHWLGDVDGAANPITVQIDAKTTVTAVFIPRQYTLDVSVIGSGVVDRIPDKPEYAFNEAVILVPRPAEETWVFSHWEGDLTGSSDPIRVLVQDDLVVNAVFTELRYALSTSVEGEGQVSVEPEQVDYAHGQTVALTATAASGWAFSHWEVIEIGSRIQWHSNNPLSIAVSSETAVVAVFLAEWHVIEVDVVGQGTVSPISDFAWYEHGAELTLTAIPEDPDWVFSRWEGDLAGTINPVTFLLEESMNVTAIFSERQHTVFVDVTGQGSVSLDPGGPTYTHGSIVTATAVPDQPNWEFSHWSGDLGGTANPARFDVTRDLSISAVFVEARYALSASTTGSGSVTVAPEKPDYAYGDHVTIAATAEYGWLFSHWEGDAAGTANPIVIEIDSDTAVTAVFNRVQHAVDVTIIGQGAVNQDPHQSEYGYGTQVTLVAVPDNRGWAFSHWLGDVTGNTNPGTVDIDGDMSITAVFIEVPHVLSLSTDGMGTVSADPAQSSYTHGESVQISATPSDGWLFSHWSGNHTGRDNPASVQVIGETIVTANFVNLLDGLITNFYSSIEINGRAHGLSFSVWNSLPEPVTIHSVEVRRANGTVFASSSDPTLLGHLSPAAGIGLSLSPGVPPLISEVRSWTVHWFGSHNGEAFEKVGTYR